MNTAGEESEDFIAIISDVNIFFFAFNGHDVARALPFHDAVMFPLKPGILLHVCRDDTFIELTCTQPIHVWNLYLMTYYSGECIIHRYVGAVVLKCFMQTMKIFNYSKIENIDSENNIVYV